jgi:VWFA-related protein
VNDIQNPLARALRSLSRRELIASAVYPIGARWLRGQQTPAFSTEVKVVNIFATIRDKKGRIIRNLEKEDFTIFENGKPETIRYFSQESDLPLTIALLVDTSLSQVAVLENERGASYRFLDQVLRENRDKAAVVQFDQTVIIRQPSTSSHKDLQDTLSLLDAPNAQQAAYGSGTLLYDAVRTASIQLMRKE